MKKTIKLFLSSLLIITMVLQGQAVTPYANSDDISLDGYADELNGFTEDISFTSDEADMTCDTVDV
ncbi:MAG: hypothetical protein IKX95_08485, partial [Lachnospiraceae bacterium]|nr:hypothetical protein [Lachnospiraceae bacterium]